MSECLLGWLSWERKRGRELINLKEYQVYKLWSNIRIRVLWDKLLIFNFNLKFYSNNYYRLILKCVYQMILRYFSEPTADLKNLVLIINWQNTTLGSTQTLIFILSVVSQNCKLWLHGGWRHDLSFQRPPSLLKGTSSLPRRYYQGSHNSRGIPKFWSSETLQYFAQTSMEIPMNSNKDNLLNIPLKQKWIKSEILFITNEEHFLRLAGFWNFTFLFMTILLWDMIFPWRASFDIHLKSYTL